MHFKKQRTDTGCLGGIEEPSILPLQLSCKSKSILKIIFFNSAFLRNQGLVLAYMTFHLYYNLNNSRS